uniref:Uncharacterized protein n=1 Tax=Phyllostachys edulis TaxID=38705 RepID=D3IVT8_PHYED|nr:hypothetical protein [Phyllostachys edulis]
MAAPRASRGEDIQPKEIAVQWSGKDQEVLAMLPMQGIDSGSADLQRQLGLLGGQRRSTARMIGTKLGELRFRTIEDAGEAGECFTKIGLGLRRKMKKGYFGNFTKYRLGDLGLNRGARRRKEKRFR